MRDAPKVLLLCPDPERIGGVSNYCSSLLHNYDGNCVAIERFTVGKRAGAFVWAPALLTTLYDAGRLFWKLFDKQYALLHLNPSLGHKNLLREGLFLWVAKLHSRPVVVFWHGWDPKFANWLGQRRFVLSLFRASFNRAELAFVLASSFKKSLREWGFRQQIEVETTAFDDSLVEGFSPDNKIKEIRSNGKLTLLFFSRLELAKGVLDTIDAFLALNMNGRLVELIIAGGGPDADLVRKRVEEAGDSRISLVGYVRGTQKRKILEQAHVLLLPTSYGEGLPVAILEAMAFGMPIITRPAGGIPDNFSEGENGYYLPDADSLAVGRFLTQVLSDKEKLADMARRNHIYARQSFTASMVTRRVSAYYSKLIHTGAA